MSHYPKRPRIHPHSRNYELPFKDSGYSEYSNGNNSRSSSRSSRFFSFGGALNADEKSEKTQKQSKTRAIKSFFGLILLILIVGTLNSTNNTSVASSSSNRLVTVTSKNSNSTEFRGRGRGTNPMISKTNENGALVQDSNGQHFLFGKVIRVPENFHHFADLSEPLEPTDRAVFWHIPRSGGSTIKDVTAMCMDLTLASQMGSVGGHIEDEELTIVDHLDGGRYVNVDTTTEDGLERAKELDLASFPGVDIIATPYIIKTGELFDYDKRGRCFFMFRHPIERAVSMYHSMRLDPNSPLFGGDSLEQYAASEMVENNWVTRFLSNQLGGELTQEHEAIAREVLRQKCLVGLLSRKATSIQRFEQYFGWKTKDQKSEHCKDELLNWNWPGKNKHPRIKEGSVVYRALEDQNTFDLRLYNYALQLFEEQEALIRNNV